MKTHTTIHMLITLFKTFFKIGLFTFGGGYGMISLVHDECVEKKSWVTDEEFVNLISIAESTPGPIAINMSTYVGYRIGGIVGAIISTIAVVLPSLFIILFISKYIDSFLNIKLIASAFFGIRIAVSLIIVRTGYNLILKEYKTSEFKTQTLILFIMYAVTLILLNIFNIKITSVYLIIVAIIIGIILYIIRYKTKSITSPL